MLQHFTDGARRAVVLSQEEARGLAHSTIGTEHMLLGLLHEAGGLAAQAMISLGMSLEATRDRIEAELGRGSSTPSGHIPFTPAAKRVLEASFRESLQRSHDEIGTEHLLLGLIRVGEGLGVEVLEELSGDARRVRERLLQLMGEIPGGPAGGPR